MVKKKQRFLGGQKMVQKWPKNDPNGQKSDGGAQKNPKKIEKMAKTGPTEHRVIALKRVKMH